MQLAGVMGWPIAHSLSPRLHSFWLEALALRGAYLPLAVEPDKLEAATRGLAALGFRGANVTVPHKEAVMRYCDTIDDQAGRIGAVNTLIISEAGITGRNTDALGFIANLRAGAPEHSHTGSIAVVLGAGGAARAVAVALLDAGCAEIRVCNRSLERAQTLAENFGERVRPIPWASRSDALEGARLLVNTTSLGMTNQPALDIDLHPLPADALVSDIVYNPLMTDLLARAQARGLRVVDGLGMLLHQAAPGFAAWFGVEPVVDDALRAHVLAGLTP